MAILVGLESCPGCKIIHEAHPEVQYVVVPRTSANADKDVFEVKKALGRLGVTKFPVLLDDSMQAIIPLEKLDPKLKGYNED